MDHDEPRREASEHESEHELGFRALVRERAIRLRTMERPLRLATGLAVAQLAAAALLVALRDTAMPSVTVYSSDRVVDVPLPVLLVSLVLATAGLTYLLAGAFHCRPWVRIAAVAGLTAALIPARDLVGDSFPRSLLALAAVAGLWLLAAVTALADSRAATGGDRVHSLRRRLTLVVFLLVVLLVAGFAASGTSRSLAAWSLFVGEMLLLSIGLTPVLFLAGADFAEWGHLTVTRVAGLARLAARPAVVAALCVAAAAGTVAAVVHADAGVALSAGAIGLGVCAVGAGAAWLARVNRGWPHHLPFAALGVVAVAVMAAMLTGSYVFSVRPAAAARAAAPPWGTLAVYRGADLGVPVTIAVPSRWKAATTTQGDVQLVTFTGGDGSGAASFEVLTGSPADFGGGGGALQSWLQACCSAEQASIGAQAVDGVWVGQPFTLGFSDGRQVRAMSWLGEQGGRIWLLDGQSTPGRFDADLPLFTEMRRSFGPSLVDEESPAPNARELVAGAADLASVGAGTVLPDGDGAPVDGLDLPGATTYIAHYKGNGGMTIASGAVATSSNADATAALQSLVQNAGGAAPGNAPLVGDAATAVHVGGGAGLVWRSGHDVGLVLVDGSGDAAAVALHAAQVQQQRIESVQQNGEQTGAAVTEPDPNAPSQGEQVATLAGLACIPLTVAAIVLALMRRRRPGPLAAGALLVAVSGAIVVAATVPHVLHAFFHGPDGPSLVLPDGLQVAVAAVALVVVGVAAARRRLQAAAPLLTLLVVLLAGLQVIAWIADLYGAAQDVSGRFSVAQALVLVLALAWDLVMSGYSITNRDSRGVPRHARVLLWMGYIVLVASAVLLFSSMRVSGGGQPIEPVFESELWPHAGLVILGAGLVMTLFLMAVPRLRPAARAADHAEGVAA
ncbi:MAG TPA: hypothetical protein VFC09_13910 [Candidatus Dormibacteraeota bacterium]|nr:hypothetical protein [Candidatus Dormibacteraeota bacterium]